MADEKQTYQMTMARTENYWISPDVLYLTLNAMGQPDYLQGNVSSGAVIMCYIRSIDGLSYDAGHNYRRWPLAVSPTYFNTSTAKYVYVAIPKSDAVNAYAQVVFPSEQIDIYGKNADGKQVASDQYYFIFLQGIISASIDANGATQMRTWSQRIDCGSLASDEALAVGGADSWWQYSSVDDTITFLKTITNAVFDNLTAKVANIKDLILGGKSLTGVAEYPTTDANSETEVVTPKYVNDKGNQEYLSKTHDDTTEHKLTMGDAEVKGNLNVGQDAKVSKDLQIKGTTTFGEFSGGELTGQGGQIDSLGNAILQSLTVRGRMKVTELVMNRLSLVESDYNFTENGTIDSATFIGDNNYRLVMRKRWDKDVTPFAVDDVCYGSINNILDLNATEKEIDTCWFKVASVETETNTLIVSLYADKDVPDQKNSAPVAGMVVARRGNSKDTDRQSSWYLSSSEGGIVLLHGVTKPIVDVTNYAGFIGLSSILKGLYPGLHIPNNDFVFYGDKIYAHDFVTINKTGEPEYHKRDRGVFVKGTTYYHGLDPNVNQYVQDEVWYGDIFWQCDNTNDGSTPPRWNNTDWTALSGGDNWTIDFKCTSGIAINVAEKISVRLEALVYQGSLLLTCQSEHAEGYDMSTNDVWWTRESKAADGTDLDAAGDDAWNALHKQTTWKNGLVLDLTERDFPSTWTSGCRVGFRVHCIVNSAEKTGIFDLN